MSIKLSALMLIALTASNSWAEVYKCTNAQGQLLFTDIPCGSTEGRKTPPPKPKVAVPPVLSAPVEKLQSLIKRFTDGSTTEKPLPSNCDGRTRCSEMSSCEEATYFNNNCTNTEMDGDHDGVPCESQWCQ
ncbi:MAG: excalibur calcium-binding domain-containing protein [Methylococcales bacterium]|nr:excalibur calcium-binding domain-containing protein [Methylococcales bacterium]